MAPEQAKGKPVDRRADLWAFGAVASEMLTGERAFPGDDVSESLAAVIRAEPVWSLLPPATPASIRRLLRRCLTKDRRERLADASDARIEIRDALKAPDDRDGESLSPLAPALWQRPAGVAGIGLVSMLLGILAASTFVGPPVPTPGAVRRFEALLEFEDAAVSPDGGTLVYTRSEAGVHKLFQLPLDRLEPNAIPATEGARSPFFSLDGRWVGFLVGDQLKKVALDGGAPVAFASVPDVFGATWGPEGVIILGRNGQGLATIPDAGGELGTLTTLEDGELGQRLPRYVASARAVVFVSAFENESERILARFLDTGEQRFLVEGSDPGVVPGGYRLMRRAQTIWAVAMDPERLVTRGDPVPMVDGVEGFVATGFNYVVAPDGTLIFVP